MKQAAGVELLRFRGDWLRLDLDLSEQTQNCSI